VQHNHFTTEKLVVEHSANLAPEVGGTLARVMPEHESEYVVIVWSDFEWWCRKDDLDYV